MRALKLALAATDAFLLVDPSLFIRHPDGIAAAAFVSDVDHTQCETLPADLKSGRMAFLFTVDKLSKGLDVPAVFAEKMIDPSG